MSRAPQDRPAVAPDGRIAAAKYGEHIDDQWSVDELLAHAAATA
ncbi:MULTISPECIES: hypothetical protein [Streptomyces]|uniref:Uncharacterized protein n=2 Tax=Streptomyces TaxID=1883 RepID=A0ABU4KBF8_9ACTN|nr:hypothetical protein [Streptomyces roseolus]MDX2295109.1 hypothetical protein [Streptomyces roseolus]